MGQSPFSVTVEARNLSRLRGLVAVLSMTAPLGAVEFAGSLAPVLERKCLACHNPNNAKGDLSMATGEDMRSFGEGLIVPGNHRASLLYEVAVPQPGGEKPEMPKKGDPLTDEEAVLLARWIDAGAPWPEGLVLREASKADKSWWAYQPLAESPPPGTAGHPVDRFIDVKLEERGLEMNPPAEARVFIRRATYGLTGLPPTPEEVASFETDFAGDPDAAVGALIDRLLASPAYGERWGRHWLDVVRFGESNGFERNVVINDLWPFRDYVIRSLNEDKPFDRFIREHLAGDVIGAGDPEVEIGSAFLVAGPYDNVNNQDADQKAQIRANTLDEIINATGEAFLGMTLGCARCHDHKFDPVSSRDYYALYASFAGVRHGTAPLASTEEKKKRAARLKPLNERLTALRKARADHEAAIFRRAMDRLPELEADWKRPPVDRAGTEERFEPLPAKFVRLVCEAQDINPATAAGFRIDELEVWTAGPEPRNVALAANGGRATGKAREIRDFPGAYGAHLAIDGKFGARFISTGNDLTVELAEPSVIDRVYFSSARDESKPAHRKFVFVAAYRIEVSDDGKSWREVAHGRNRKPVGKAHRDHRVRQRIAPTAEEEAEQKRLQRQIAAVEKQIKGIPPLRSAWIGTRSEGEAKGPFHVFLGGSPRKKGEEVRPASLSTLSEVMPSYELEPGVSEAERRRALADWITRPDNPLTARVLANRLWHYHFGTGIVDTPSDFGYMGGRPTHPELLDFLARQLIGNGWRLKPMHRLVMTSRAYRQSSRWRADAARIDGDSRLLWRFPPRRLSAEEIRDTFLHLAGRLDPGMGGPGFRLYEYLQDNVATYVPLDEHGPATYRRAVYHQNARASVVDLMTEFDQPDCAFSTPRRSETTTPLQALTMLNHSFTIDMAQAMSERIESRAGRDRVARVREAFALAYQRGPDADEMERCSAVIETHGFRAFCRALLNSSELIHLD